MKVYEDIIENKGVFLEVTPANVWSLLMRTAQVGDQRRIR